MEIRGLQAIEKWINTLTFDQLLEVYENFSFEEDLDIEEMDDV